MVAVVANFIVVKKKKTKRVRCLTNRERGQQPKERSLETQESFNDLLDYKRRAMRNRRGDDDDEDENGEKVPIRRSC
jgi:hypothetical protein